MTDEHDEPDAWLSPCEEVGEHRDYSVMGSDESTYIYYCHTCGAEWWDEE